jgi:hypothetical protein
LIPGAGLNFLTDIRYALVMGLPVAGSRSEIILITCSVRERPQINSTRVGDEEWIDFTLKKWVFAEV